MRKKLIEEMKGTCPVCGSKNVPLEIDFIVPISQGGTDQLANINVSCANCHRAKHRAVASEMEFNYYLHQLLEKHPGFKDTLIETPILKDPVLRADIITNRILNQKKCSVLIECKNASFLNDNQLKAIIDQIKQYRKNTHYDAYAFAFPGRISDKSYVYFGLSKIEIWDADFIATTFRKEIENTQHPYFRNLFMSLSSINSLPIERQLLANLNSCQPGKKHWSDYQKLVGKIFEHLFCPPLASPKAELSDKHKLNRRDLIFPNYSDSGFWHFLRQMYQADYIVIDAKNYKKPISKSQVLQIANYLKLHGAGLFAIIASRKGVSNSAELTIREQWFVYNKMIVVLDDSDLENMLLSSSSSGDPSQVIGQAIEDFRLSI
jgi:hypothetical protein